MLQVVFMTIFAVFFLILVETPIQAMYSYSYIYNMHIWQPESLSPLWTFPMTEEQRIESEDLVIFFIITLFL